ncbi:hypothetical protein NQ315_014570 [Exocentrus adspersus]|uniref:PiggyBac transposable element-derived protein domain-containing protein n=1 Tax=Exocentrus adspersus TaxID=1586481 RepID=A0AAV8VEV5_9CUCU|nr:hypothetical protein NQ315_014570 [Exocentrus adspersus]
MKTGNLKLQKKRTHFKPCNKNKVPKLNDNVSENIPGCSFWAQNSPVENDSLNDKMTVDGQVVVENEHMPEIEETVQNEDVADRSDNSRSDEELIPQNNMQTSWRIPVGNHKVFDYDAEAGLSANYDAVLPHELSPYSCFRAFLTDNILVEMVHQTNLYATEILTESEDTSSESRLHRWTPTNEKEMFQFMGIIAYIGVVKMPTLESYWSKDDLFRNSFIPKIMSRNRFQLLLRMWHFSSNKECPEGDRLHRIQPLLDMLNKNYQEIYTPGRTFCIDESIIPFQGRLLLKQYIPQKTHKYGVKLFKLCCDNGYTWNIRIYAGKEQNQSTTSVPSNVVVSLSEKLLDSGRTIVADNYYSSLELANILLSRKTHYIGTLRSNRRGNPKEVLAKKLKRREVFGLENEDGICVMKWRDKRDVLMISTKHTTETVDIERRTCTIKKPKAIIDYNESKSSIDISDQMASYHTALRRSLRWYKKLAIEFIFGTTLVNAHTVYNKLADKKLSITKYREELIKELVRQQDDGREILREIPQNRKSMRTHAFQKKEGLAVKSRRYCKGCYSKKIKGETSKNKVKKVSTYCGDCENNPHYCLACFNMLHNK